MRTFRRSAPLALVTLATAVLTACGGGGGSSPSANGNVVSGVAATGLAISNGQVSLRCASGTTPTVTTNPDGSYSIDVSTATLPCIARVTYTDAKGVQELHSLVKTPGTVNITPLTDMVVASLSSTGTAKSTYDNFKASDVAGYSEQRVQTAMQQVKTRLEMEGVDTAKLPTDLIGTQLQAAHEGMAGDDQDKVLDALHARLEQTSTTVQEVEHQMYAGHESGLSTSTGTLGNTSAGQAAYTANCASCHGARVSDAMNAANILEAVRENQGGMGALSSTVTPAMANDIATYMTNLMKGGSMGPVMKSQTITFTWTYGDQTLGTTPPALSASASSSLPAAIASTTPAVCTVAGTTLTLVAAGSCSLTASQAGDTTYSAAPSVTVSFTVKSPSGTVLTSQTISFTLPGTLTVGTTATLAATATSGLPVTFASTTPTVCTVIGTTLTPVAAGTCTMTADQGGDATYAAAPTVTQGVTVTAAPTTSTASASNGKALYASNSCSGCHGTPPSTLKVLNGANNPSVIRNAINSVGMMSSYSSLTDAQLADMAAYLATPTI